MKSHVVAAPGDSYDHCHVHACVSVNSKDVSSVPFGFHECDIDGEEDDGDEGDEHENGEPAEGDEEDGDDEDDGHEEDQEDDAEPEPASK